MFLRARHVLACALLMAAAAAAPACGGDDDGSSGGGGDTGSTTGTGTGDGGAGGGTPCVDTQTDPLNCGACGNECVPGMICEAGACVCGPATATFSQAQSAFGGCAGGGCHGGASPKGGFDLGGGGTYDELMTETCAFCTPPAPLVVPGNPTESYIIRSITGRNTCGVNPMPPGGRLTDTQIANITEWICAGAPNN